MRLIAIKFKNYNRFSLNPRLNNFTIDLDKPILIVAGDNGSGKSTLCQAMLPWPVNKQLLSADGMVQRTWIHDNKNIVDTVDSDGYSFVVEGEELNLSRGVRLQESLFTEYFGVDLPVIRLLSGEHTFTNMSSKQRQYWMSRLDQFQLEKLEDALKSLKDMRKEKDILLAHNNTQLNKYPVIDNIPELELERDALSERITKLMTAQYTLKNVPKNILNELLTALNKRISLQALLRSRQQPRLTINEIKELLAIAHTKRNACISSISSLSVDALSVDGLPTLEECIQAIDTLTSYIRHIPDSHNLPDKLNHWLSITVTVYEYVNHLTTNLDYESVNLNDVVASHASILQHVNKLLEIKQQIITHIDLISNNLHDKITCPACSNIFGRYGGETEIHNLTSELSEIEKSILDYRQQLEQKSKYISEIKKYQDTKEYVLNRICELSPTLKDMLCNTQVSSWISFINELNTNISISAENRRILRQIDTLTGYVNIHNTYKASRHQQKLEEKRIQEEMINVLDVEISNLEHAARQVTEYNSIYREWCINDELLNRLYRQLPDYTHNILIEGLIQASSVSTAELRNRLNTVVYSLSVAEANQRHNADITAIIADLTSQLCTINEAISILDGKYGFIGHLYKERVVRHITELNKLLSILWNYELKVILPDLATFKFPIVVEGVTREDVSCGSKGMSEVINLAFILLVRQECHLGHIPLILDELGSALDPVNLENTYSYLLEYPTDQLVMVSHVSEVMQFIDECQSDYLVLSDRHLNSANYPANVNMCLTYL